MLFIIHKNKLDNNPPKGNAMAFLKSNTYLPGLLSQKRERRFFDFFQPLCPGKGEAKHKIDDNEVFFCLAPTDSHTLFCQTLTDVRSLKIAGLGGVNRIDFKKALGECLYLKK